MRIAVLADLACERRDSCQFGRARRRGTNPNKRLLRDPQWSSLLRLGLLCENAAAQKSAEKAAGDMAGKSL